jgi:sugar phosphate isomerase/epimerase
MKISITSALTMSVLGATFITMSNAVASPIPDECRIGGFAIGCQAYSFKNFSAVEAVQKTAQAGGKVIEFYPGQKFSLEEPSLRWDHRATDEMVTRITDELKKNNVRAVNYGVVGARDEAEWRQIFEFAKKLDLYAITTESVAQLDIIEALVKEFDIRVAIHNHPRKENDPNYKVWDPAYVLSVVKDRDPRIGACADTGHWLSSGIVPVEALRTLKGRIISSHLKDRPVIGKALPDVPYGTGVADVAAILAELKSQGFEGNISIEYEANWDHSVPEVGQCVGFLRGYAATAK